MSIASDIMAQRPQQEWRQGYLFVENENYSIPKLRRDKCELCLNYGGITNVKIGFHVFDVNPSKRTYGMIFFEDDPLDSPEKEMFFADVSYYADEVRVDNAVDSQIQVTNQHFEVVAESLVKFTFPIIYEFLIKGKPPRDSNGDFEWRWYLVFTRHRLDDLQDRTGISPRKMAFGLMEMSCKQS